MTAALALPTVLPGRLHEHGLDLPPDLTLEQWTHAFALAEAYDRASPWVVADLLVYGEDRFGEDHAAVLPTLEEDPTGARQEQLKQYRWMARAWPAGTRVPGATFTHHRIVTNRKRFDREDARGLLVTAVTATDADGTPRPWSTRELADEVRRRESAITAPAVPVETGCSADTTEGLTIEDLTDDARAALHRIAHDQRVLPEVAGRVFVAALVYVGALDCFVRQP